MRNNVINVIEYWASVGAFLFNSIDRSITNMWYRTTGKSRIALLTTVQLALVLMYAFKWIYVGINFTTSLDIIVIGYLAYLSANYKIWLADPESNATTLSTEMVDGKKIYFHVGNCMTFTFLWFMYTLIFLLVSPSYVISGESIRLGITFIQAMMILFIVYMMSWSGPDKPKQTVWQQLSEKIKAAMSIPRLTPLPVRT